MATMEERKTNAGKTLNYLLDFLGLDATVRAEEKNEKIAIKITSDDAGRIIGRNGQTLESLQYLLNLVLFKQDKEFPRVVLDIDGYAKGERKERKGEDGERMDRGERSERGGERRERRERHSDAESGFTEENLQQQAMDAAKEVKRWGDPVTLPAMNAHDRRIIHVTLQDDAEITTESIGDGAFKKVVISAKK